jgi:hypothetical protein
MDARPVAFIFQTHLISNAIISEYRKIVKGCQGMGVAWLLYQGNELHTFLESPDLRLCRCTLEDIKDLGYPFKGSSLLPGHTHYPLAHFYRKYPGYDYYWLIEHDVRFSGKWQVLFNAFANIHADLVAAHFVTYSEEPEWPLWELSHPCYSIPLGQRQRCFHPIYRISNAALAFICAAHQDGWDGHSEVVFATLLSRSNFSFVDFGGKGTYVLPGMENKFYTASPPNPAGLLNKGTLRWRPVHSWIGLRRNKIYHPVKRMKINIATSIKSILNCFR